MHRAHRNERGAGIAGDVRLLSGGTEGENSATAWRGPDRGRDHDGRTAAEFNVSNVISGDQKQEALAVTEKDDDENPDRISMRAPRRVGERALWPTTFHLM
jgi:hypothetical protein